jgi:membrane-bound serine protease (ClpP class)
MRRLASLAVALAVGVPLAAAAMAQERGEPTRIEVIQVNGAIDRPLLGYLHERLSIAEREGAVVVLQLDTPGTLDQDAVALAERVAGLSVPVVAWVGPAPAKAVGAGLLLMYASSLAAVSPGSQTGPLYPVDLAAPEARPDLRATISGWLEARGKATRLERLDEPLPGADAVALGIAFREGALSVPDLLARIDGQTIQTPDGSMVLRTAIATGGSSPTVDIRFANLGPIARVTHAVATPSFVFVLLTLGLAGLAFELTQPGFGFAGFSGLFLAALAVYGLTVVPFSWLGLGLLVGGIGAMVVDVVLRRLGVWTVVGLAGFAAGSILSFNGLDRALRISPWLIGGAVVASALYYGFGLTVALQSRDRIVSTQRGLIGLVGEARGRLAPDGPVYVKGALWRGRSGGEPIEQGAAVRVRGVDGLILRVEPEPGRDEQDPALLGD